MTTPNILSSSIENLIALDSIYLRNSKISDLDYQSLENEFFALMKNSQKGKEDEK